MHAAQARGNVVTQRGIDGPERAVLRNRFQKTMRWNQMRLRDVLERDRRQIGLESLMPR